MKTKATLSFTLISALLLMSGCASTSNYKKADSTSDSLEATAQIVNQSNLQAGVVTKELKSLLESPSQNIRPQFEKFDSAVSKLDTLTKDLYVRSTSIQSKGADYFTSWDEDLATIRNEDIRSRSAERRQTMAARFEEVRISYEKVKTELTLFVSNLKDIRTVLATDLTTDGLGSLKDTAEDSGERAKQLEKTLGHLEVEFRDLSASMSTTTHY